MPNFRNGTWAPRPANPVAAPSTGVRVESAINSTGANNLKELQSLNSTLTQRLDITGLVNSLTALRADLAGIASAISAANPNATLDKLHVAIDRHGGDSVKELCRIAAALEHRLDHDHDHEPPGKTRK
jgi:hypothetical protein